MPLSIRRLTSQDGLAYQRLRLMALQQNPEAFLSVYEVEKNKKLSAFAHELEYALAEPDYGYYGVFADDSQSTSSPLVAFSQVAKSYLAKQQHVAWIYNLFVDLPYRRQGVAATLLTHLMNQVTSTESIELFLVGCNAKNKPAIQLYKSLGFQRCGVHPRSVKWGGEYDDEVQLVKVWTDD